MSDKTTKRKDGDTTQNYDEDGRYVLETSVDEMMKMITKVRSTMSAEDISSAFDTFFIDELNGNVQFRTLMASVPVFWKHKLITEEQVSKFCDKFVQVLQEERAKLYAPLARMAPRGPDMENPQTFVIIEAGKNKTLSEISSMFYPSQEERFVRENFQPKVLGYVYDMCANPGDYQGKGLTKFIFKAVSKMVKPDNLVNALSQTMQFSWKDDGLSENASFQVFMSKSSIEKKNAKKSTLKA